MSSPRSPREELMWRFAPVDDPMSEPTEEELMRRFGPVHDPVIEARRQKIARTLVRLCPEVKQEFIDEGIAKEQMIYARSLLRRVLARRQLTPSEEDDARIEACTDITTLERWFDQAVTAATVAEALA